MGFGKRENKCSSSSLLCRKGRRILISWATIIGMVYLCIPSLVDSFLTSSITTCRRYGSCRSSSSREFNSYISSRLFLGSHGQEKNDRNDDDDDDDDDDEDDLDIAAARRQFENLMRGEEEDNNNNSSSSSSSSSSSRSSSKVTKKKRRRSRLPHALRLSEHNPPPLTTIMRERREVEIQLLESLRYGDTAMSDLWSLWFAERGPQAATRLLEVEALCSKGPAFWDQAEEQLFQIIDDCGPYWAEPINRLATLYYMQGRLEDSKALCEVVLTLKPWHVGALSGIVLGCAGMGDVGGARMWADRRLPPMPPNNTTGGGRRTKWVNIFVKEANAKLERAEKETYHHNPQEDEQEQLMRNKSIESEHHDSSSDSVGVDPNFDEEDTWQ